MEYKLMTANGIYWIENKETGGLTESFRLDDLMVQRTGMTENMKGVYSLTVVVREVN